MKIKNKIILGALIVLGGRGIALCQQTVPVQLHPAAAPNVAVGPRRKFADMGVLERNAILTGLEKQDLSTIFQAMLDADRVEHDPMKQMGLQTALAGALMLKTPTPEFMEHLRAFVANSSNSQFERDLVFGALGAAATPETVKLLVELATASPDEKIRYAATGSLGTVGSRTGGGAKLSPMLERVWRESNDQALLMSVSQEMAKIGTPGSVELLLSAALPTNGSDKARMDIARDALRHVDLPDAVPPFTARLANQVSTSETAKLVAPILVKIGDVAASKAVVDWLQDRSEDATPLIMNLVVQQTRGEKMLAAWDAAVDPAVPFRNEQNREAIRAGLAVYRAGHTTK